MKTELRILIFTFLIIFLGCSNTQTDKNKIVGSWYFVEYGDKPFQRSLLDEVEKDIRTSPAERLRNFIYIFKADNTYQYKVYGRLVSKGTYSINKDNVVKLLDKIESKTETLTVKYLDDKFLQVSGVGGETDRISIYYKTDYKFPAVQTEVIR
ncbi:hypothetical protein MKJ01_18280 [Chryseobacterium sp. SSA4.19]|uniref:hypothetical protein n=1 Tax=Chryseobacterium sp. SSA4.19 TaxID=2919915 RepID=UPI001F4E8799|nr:hypothetical protein [Chryseobacterium sp. SSA4.19]MCJ8155706.1 hypothetical protein [Chryseobacterium sp. SSA4.19]